MPWGRCQVFLTLKFSEDPELGQKTLWVKTTRGPLQGTPACPHSPKATALSRNPGVGTLDAAVYPKSGICVCGRKGRSHVGGGSPYDIAAFAVLPNGSLTPAGESRPHQ